VPELPETETIARDLEREVQGAQIANFTVHRHDVLREGTADTFAATLIDARIERVWRRAKLIVLDCVHARHGLHHLVVQPRFTGGLLIADGALPDADARFVCVTASLADGRALHYKDVRRLGTVALMSPARFGAYSGALGVEPLDPALGDTEFSVLLRSTRQPIKTALMDQRRVAGVGNIYANEALWRAGIDPSRESSRISDAEAAALLQALRAVLTASIEARGTSFRDYRDARGERGRFVEQLAAYGRAGHPCLRCGRRLVGTHALDGRGTVFCPTCQH
jgi:formamidopyrimidine-DNA glycosylase